MKKTWVVVANSSQAKIYKAENAEKLAEHGILFHDESHMPARELVSDGYGREANLHTYGSEGYESKTSPHLKEALIFADVIAEFLEKGYNAGECEKIYLIAKAPFLGHLRHSLNPHIAKIVKQEIHKDLTQLSPDAVRQYLPPVL